MAFEIPLKQKDPDAIVDYDIDWAPDAYGRTNYLEDGETILTSSWAITEGDADLVLSAASIIGGTRTKIWTEGGTPGATYRVTNHITTSLSRADDRSIRLLIQDK